MSDNVRRERIDPKYFRTKALVDFHPRDVIYSVRTGLDGMIYMGVSNEFQPDVHATLARYNPKDDTIENLTDLASLFPEGRDSMRPPHSKFHTSICIGNDGVVWAATHITAPALGAGYHRIWEIIDDPVRSFSGSHVVSFDPATEKMTDHGIVIPHEGTRFLARDQNTGELHMVSYPRSHYIVFQPKTGEIRDLGRIAQTQREALGPVWSKDGCTYTTDDYGYILRYDPKIGDLQRLPVRLPNAPWRRDIEMNRVRRMIAGPDGTKLYGLSWQSVNLFEYDPTEGEYGTIHDLGVLLGEDRFDGHSRLAQGKALTFGPDGNIYIFYSHVKKVLGGPEGGHIACYNMQTGEVTDYGAVQAEGMPPVFNGQDATTGQDGTMYFGGAVPAIRTDPCQLVIFDPSGVSGEQEKLDDRARIGFVDVWQSEEARANRTFERRRKPTGFVSKGGLTLRELGWPDHGPTIPDGESAITALTVDHEGSVYGATSGSRSHLFAMTTRTDQQDVYGQAIDLGLLGAEACRALATAGNGRIFIGTSAGRILYHVPPARPPQGEGLSGEFEGEVMQVSEELATKLSPVVNDAGLVKDGESIHALTACPVSGNVYGLTSPGGLVFVVDQDTGTPRVLGEAAANTLSKSIASDAQGNLYGSAQDGHLFRYSPVDETFTILDAKLPVRGGREYLNAADALIRSRSGLIYGGTTAEGYLFSYEPTTGRIRTLGKPIRQSRIRALTEAHDGRIFGIAGEELVHYLFSYDPETGEMENLGIPRAHHPRSWTGLEFNSMVTGPGGEIYLGQAERISYLFVYYPDVKGTRARGEITSQEGSGPSLYQ
jgi:outer membrane protein assembly factor BamB